MVLFFGNVPIHKKDIFRKATMADFNGANVLVVDDEGYICNIIVESLAQENYNIIALTDPAEALDYIKNNPIDLVLTDLVMGEYTGVQLLDTTLEEHPESIVILMTAHPTVQTAISVLKKGAYDFLVKPFKLEILRATVKRGLRHQMIYRENVRLKEQVEFLKIANATSAVADMEKYLKRLAGSCKKELSASAVGLIEIDPKSKEVVREIYQTDSDEYLPHVLNEESLKQFKGGRGNEPLIETEEVTIRNKTTNRIFISQPLMVRRRLYGMINILLHKKFDRVSPGQLNVLTILTNSASSAIVNHHLYQDLQRSYIEAIKALTNAIEARDQYTRGHTDRVCQIAELVARRMGWNETQIHDLIMGCTLHDIGKIGVPDSILNKPGALTDEERELMTDHPEVGLKIIKGIELFKPAIPYIYAHHEKFDGTGYPNGLKGEDIPIEGRLLAVVDTLDAILSDRPYRRGIDLDFALNELNINKGTQFDPVIVDILLEVIAMGQINFVELYDREEDISIVENTCPKTRFRLNPGFIVFRIGTESG